MQAIARRAAAPVFAFALFSSAALIFVLQPLFGRLVTPLLGGSPAVWNTSMAFFQAALLAGYLYAHLLTQVKDLRVQAAIHAAVLIAASLVLPVHVSGAFGAPSSEHPALWLVGVLAFSVGAPFAAASATAPLLQAWYARSGRTDAHDPYYLYAASNLGSFIGLLAYPILIEPLLGTHDQATAWHAGYIAVVALIVFAAATVIAANDAKTEISEPVVHSPTPSWRERGFWMAAAAAPSALILGVTLHISTDVATAPMLWVAPLALYLATFVIAFSRGAEKIMPTTRMIYPLALIFLVAAYFSRANWSATLASNLAGFFMSALVCHLALARSRPPADKLTEFYFFVSLGGVLGGAFAAFVAPVIFNDVYEYPLALAAAALFMARGAVDSPRPADCSVAAAAAMAGFALLLVWRNPADAVLIAGAVGAAGALVAAGWSDEAKPAPLRYAFLGSAALLALIVTYVAFNNDAVIFDYLEKNVTHMGIRAPWNFLLPLASLTTLMFVAHASVQPQKPGSLVPNIGLGVAIPTLLLLIALPLMNERLDAEVITRTGLGICLFALVLNRTRPYLLATLVLISFAIIFLDDSRGGRVITQERSFFGVLRTRASEISDAARSDGAPDFRILYHGTTIHGAQLIGPGFSRQPLTYYNPRTSLGEGILAGLSTGDHSRMALIGLGAGSSACLTRSGDELTIFEIDPAVLRLSGPQGRDFTYVAECQPNARIELGDARLQIAEEPDASFDVIVVDAFSSDAIPAHLLTREAIALYLRKTSERGIVVLHLSNRNLALVSEAARVAHSLNAPTLFRVSERFQMPLVSYYGGLAASTMIVAHTPETLAHLALPSGEWRVIEAPPGRAWTDDYINLPRALWDSLTGVEECRVYPGAPNCTEAEPAPTPETKD